MKFWSDVLLCDSMMIHLECQSCRDMHAFSLPFRALSCLSRLSKHHRNLLKYGQSVKRDQTKDDRKNWSWTQNKSRLHFPAASMLFHVPTLHTELLLKSMEKKGMYKKRCKFSATQTAMWWHQILEEFFFKSMSPMHKYTQSSCRSLNRALRDPSSPLPQHSSLWIWPDFICQHTHAKCV